MGILREFGAHVVAKVADAPSRLMVIGAPSLRGQAGGDALLRVSDLPASGNAQQRITTAVQKFVVVASDSRQCTFTEGGQFYFASRKKLF